MTDTQTGKYIINGKFRWGKAHNKRLWAKIGDVKLSIKNSKIPLENAEIIEYELHEKNRFPVTQRRSIKKPKFDS